MSDATWTVRFHAGRRHFEVLCALTIIDNYSETVLGNLVASDAWNNDQ